MHLQRGIAGAQSVFDILDLPNEPDEGTKVIDNADGSIEFRNVTFGYKPNEPVLNNISFNVPAGQSIAV